MKFYAGIGSRETPPAVLEKMTNWAYRLDCEGWTLRTGGAPGADTAFEFGAGPDTRLYLPWEGFEGRKGIVLDAADYGDAESIARKFHPAWDKLRQGGKKLHTRNVAQILGHGQEKALSKFVLCWTPGGKAGGGTGQAIRIARDYDVPVFDLAVPGAEQELNDRLYQGEF